MIKKVNNETLKRETKQWDYYFLKYDPAKKNRKNKTRKKKRKSKKKKRKTKRNLLSLLGI